MGRDMTTEGNTILAAFFSGFRRVLSAPSLVVWVYLVCLLVVLPLTFSIGQTLRNSIGASLVEEEMRRGFDMGWWGEFDFYNHGLADTFGPWVVGHLLPVSHLERLLDGEIFKIDPGVTLTGVLFLCLLAFLTGGILDRYSRPHERPSRSRLFSSGSRYFFRLLRLLLISAGNVLAAVSLCLGSSPGLAGMGHPGSRGRAERHDVHVAGLCPDWSYPDGSGDGV